MIKLQFSPLSYQDSGFKNIFYSRENEYLLPSEKDIIPVTSEFNGETYDIQHITYDAYTCNFFFRDENLIRFQNINSSYKINIWEVGDQKRFNGQRFELIEQPVPELFSNEFWKLPLKLRNISSKNIENVIENTIDDTLTIVDGISPPSPIFECNVPFNCIDNVEPEDVLIENVEIRIPDYYRRTLYKQVQFYLNATDRLNLYDSLTNLSPLSTGPLSYVLQYKSTNYRQFEIDSDEQIANDYFEIKMKLISETTISQP